MTFRVMAMLFTAFLMLVSVPATAVAQSPKRPFVVILADARGTVATDMLTPYAILAESGVVDVKVVSATTDPVRLTPGVAFVKPQMTLADLERSGRRPDVVVVPAYKIDADEARNGWLREQVARGVRVMSICNGAWALASSGLLDGRQATIHWYSREKAANKHGEVQWRDDVRWITDGPVTTTAGISAGEPASLNLLRELAGDAVMRATAARLRQPLPEQTHDGGDYHLTLKGMGLTIGNTLAFWGHEKVALPLETGFDELALGTALDAWSRTYRSKAWVTGAAATTSRHGLVVYRSETPPARFNRTVTLPGPDVQQRTFDQVRQAYGDTTARFVALQFEHPYGAVSAWAA